jgi:hypothetical protein
MNTFENPVGPQSNRDPEVETSLDCIMVDDDGKSETDTTVRPARPEVLKHIPPELRRRGGNQGPKNGERDLLS